jgi:predicted RecB family nuclease
LALYLENEMSFECNSCKETVSNSKMAGLAIGHIGRAVLESKGIRTTSELAHAFDGGDLTAGVLSNSVKCPNCEKSNWSYE